MSAQIKRNLQRERLSILRLLERTDHAWKRGDFDNAVDVLERAHRKHPQSTKISIELAKRHGSRYNFDSAQRLFEAALQAARQRSNTLCRVARCCRGFERRDIERHYLERALKETSRLDPFLLGRLSELCAHSGHLAEGQRILHSASKEQKSHPHIRYCMGRMERLLGNLTRAERLLKTVIKDPAADSETQVMAFYDLAMIFDKTRQYDDAWTALLDAKSMQRLAQPQWLQYEDIRREMSTKLSGNVVACWQKQAKEMLRERRIAVLCGYPRSGTSLLEEMLDSHPEIAATDESTIMNQEAYLPLSRGFLPGTSLLNVLESASPSLLRDARERYFDCAGQLLGKPVGGRLLVDKNPALTDSLPIVMRIFPEAKVILALRDPRDVCLSSFMQYLMPNFVHPTHLSLNAVVSDYTRLMTCCLSMEPVLNGQCIRVRYEDVVCDPSGELQKTLKFLGLSWNDEVLRFHEHARKKIVTNPSFSGVVQPLYQTSLSRWRNYEKYFEPYQEMLAPFVKAFGYN